MEVINIWRKHSEPYWIQKAKKILMKIFYCKTICLLGLFLVHYNLLWGNPSQLFLCSFENSEGLTRFCWTQSQQGLLKSAFFIGYVLLQVHGGSLAEKFGTKIVLGFICVLLPSVLTLLTPIATAWNFWALFTIRILIGLAESATFPSLPPLVSRYTTYSRSLHQILLHYSKTK